MRFLWKFVIATISFGTVACQGELSSAETKTHVLGFVTNCGNGATALITQFARDTDDPEPDLAMDPQSFRAGDPNMRVSSIWRGPLVPFEVLIDERIACVFPTSRPSLIVEAKCGATGSSQTTCRGRINFQGFRAAPEPYRSDTYEPHLAQGAFNATPPEKLFDEADLKHANMQERQRTGYAL